MMIGRRVEMGEGRKGRNTIYPIGMEARATVSHLPSPFSEMSFVTPLVT